MTILGVTGQRPKSLGLKGFDANHPVWLDAYDFVARSIDDYGATRLVSGGALGFDMIAGKAAVDKGIELELALPFEGYAGEDKSVSDVWAENSVRKLRWLIKHSAEYYYVCEPGYAPWKYQVRNEKIVERSDYMVALWNGEPGGTGNCLKAAQKAGVDYEVHDPLDMSSL